MNIAPNSSTQTSSSSNNSSSSNTSPKGFNQPQPAATHEAAHLTQPKKSFAFQSLGDVNQNQAQPVQQLPTPPANRLQGSGAAFKPPGGTPPGAALSTGENQPPISNKLGAKSKKTSIILLVVAFIFMLISGAGLFYITQILPEQEVPTDPASEPAASVPIIPTLSPKPTEAPTCTLSFAIDQPEVTPSPTVTPDPSVTPTITPTATPTSSPGPTVTPDPEATATPEPEATNTPAPTTVALAPTSTPVPPAPGQPRTQVIDTKADCNQACATNADCRNVSHICYNGRCRLDVNPEDDQCRTPTGETTVTRMVETPEAGFGEWMNFLRVGIGAVGLGLLMLLFL